MFEQRWLTQRERDKKRKQTGRVRQQQVNGMFSEVLQVQHSGLPGPLSVKQLGFHLPRQTDRRVLTSHSSYHSYITQSFL